MRSLEEAGVFSPHFSSRRQFTLSFQMSFLHSIHSLSTVIVFLRGLWEILELWVTMGMVVGKGREGLQKNKGTAGSRPVGTSFPR